MPTQSRNPFIEINSDGSIDPSETTSRISQGLTFIQDIEILREQAGEEYDLSRPGSFAYFLFVDTLRAAVVSLTTTPALKEVNNG